MAIENANRQKALVVKSTGSHAEVEIATGERLSCRIRGKLRMEGLRSTNPLAVGDEVYIQSDEREQWVIDEILERKNYIVRKSVNLSKEIHIIAANLDQAVLVVTVASPQTSFGFIDRFLASCEAYDVPAVLVFNKIDQYGEIENELLEEYMLIYKNIGYQCIQTSAITGEGLTSFGHLLKNKISLLSGHSGVGKSSLINAISPGLKITTASISDSHQKGQHTTTFAEMHTLINGGRIVDSPGIKGFGLTGMKSEEIGDYFRDIFEISKNCRFHNCMHLEEPGCAVKKALDDLKLAPTRYQSYLSMLDEDDGSFRKDKFS